MVSLEAYGLADEPTAMMALEAGASLVLMSGDKLLGGPQAGIILGAATLIAKLRKNPLARAMRVDKLTLSALEATLRLYLEPERALREIPVLSMITASLRGIEARAEAIVTKLRASGIEAKVADSSASVGGGAFPTAAIPSCAIVLSRNAQEVEKNLRLGEPAVIGRMSEGNLLLDLRSVLPREDELLAEAIIRLAPG
jgi:L-seryl-tRNA(Ser) seleniumtransferase